jgi:hypothetical protein
MRVPGATCIFGCRTLDAPPMGTFVLATSRRLCRLVTSFAPTEVIR